MGPPAHPPPRDALTERRGATVAGIAANLARGAPLSPADLTALAVAARDGDRRAFDDLVRATSGLTYTLAMRLTGDEHDARDVVQDTYLRAYRAIGSFRGDAQFTTWLHRITANCASTYIRRRRRHRHEHLADDAPLADEVPERDPQGMALAGSLRDGLVGALDALPPKLKAVVVLRDIYDLPHEAIAAELGIPVSTAKVRLHRARRKLKERLFPDSVDSGRAV